MRALCVSALLAICAATLPVSAQALMARYQLTIERQPLDGALKDFAHQTKLQVARFSDTMDGSVMAGPVVGEYTAAQALQTMLEPNGLTYRLVNERTIAVVRPGDDINSLFSSPSTGNASGVESGAGTTNSAGDRRKDWARLAQAVDTREYRQTVNSQESGQPQAVSRSNESPTKLEGVIVTARKRTERIQDVPISIFAITADDIDRRGLIGAGDYLRGIPGANQVDSGYGQSIVIRGIETSPDFQNFWSGTTVATYFGETPTTNSAGVATGTNVDLKLVDIERVEVLRGPQGTAFGNSSMGGAVRVIPVAPKRDVFEGKVHTGYSVTSGTGGDNHSVYVVGNVPVIKNRLAIRGTAYQYQDSGFYSNRAGSNADFRVAVVTPFGAEAFAVDQEEVGDYYVRGGRVAALFQATDDLGITLSYLAQRVERDGFPLATIGTYEQTLLNVAPEHVRRGEKEGSFDTDIDIANATIEYNLGWADLLATYSYTESGTVDSSSFTSFGLGWPLSYVGDNDHRAHVGEIRLATQLDGAWNFLVGLYHEDLDDELLQDYLWHGDPATNFFTPGERFIGVYPDRRNLKQKAAFGEASWEMVPGLTLTGGVRAYEYDRTFRLDAEGAFYGPDGIHVNERTEASGKNFRANLSYKLNNALVYAGWSEGFRLGQLQPGLAPGACDLDGDGLVDGTDITIESTREVNSDDVDSYEFGAKFAFLDGRMRTDVAIFRMDWSDMPVTVRPGTGSCLLGYLANAGEARSEGIELQTEFQITDAFRVDAGASWIDARLTKDAPALNAPKGNRLPGAPDVNANLSPQYEFEIGGRNTIVRADLIYIGSFYADLAQSPFLRSGDYVKLDASARVAIGRLSVEVFGRNLTNEDAFTFRGTFGFGEFSGYRLRPRTIGIQFGYTF